MTAQLTAELQDDLTELFDLADAALEVPENLGDPQLQQALTEALVAVGHSLWRLEGTR